ncbi:12836_t:CDS:2, partial [Racocetra fulgida]
EPEEELKIYALKKLNEIVDQFWAEISDAVQKIWSTYTPAHFRYKGLTFLGSPCLVIHSEILYEDESFPQRQLSALVASKVMCIFHIKKSKIASLLMFRYSNPQVYYHLGEFDDSLTFALGAGDLFDASSKLEYAIGIALKARRLDVFEEAINKGPSSELLAYVLDLSMTLVLNLDFRNKALLLMAYQIAFDLEENATQEFLQRVINELPVGSSSSSTHHEKQDGEAMETDETESASQPDEKYVRIRNILSGEESIKLHLEFLYRNNHTDLLILKNTKGLTLLQPYLPQDGVNGSSYSEGGSLFALGLIHANHGAGVLDYLRNALRNTQTEVLQHGACLGLGAAGMATENNGILSTVLFSDSAVAGEAAGLAMGLVMLGTASKKAIEEMLQYAHETQHEKIIRGLAI